ncbi:SUMF1/EgtB/PvdO family nonheme iron enzyme [Pusillimonas sp. TS35]|nr:SUMF1/EgtB/PvdO family nonheme iron enzyme [Pusillimonas sp. TS35]
MASVQPAAPQAVAATPIIVDGLEFVVLPPAEVFYYPPGEYLEDGYPVNPPQYVATFERDVKIARRQVSQAEYAACVRAGACKPLDRAFRENTAPDLPAIGISWRDATAYAQWLSQKTGHHFRLPVYEEWVYAAGSAYKEDVLLGNFNPADPAQRWLAEYTLETQRKTSVDPAVRPFGSFGENDRGLLDMAGNVWDWTDTCHTRRKIGGDGLLDATGDNCGIRVTAGPHRSYITDFIRDPKSGACSVGVPPSNLGFRLVLDESAPVQSTGPSLRERLGLG